ncbi:hypothetical protein KDA_70430 [Dictyobacter alpinus]|uniref:Uncharacterized protein n=1 Tax=Dictyobacter alpinus TaxID=2014873 RepID=A0A402BJN0_9CHLR|nr:hypothetical protein KDA_70430 [Dictyobacter alpinus]
MRKANFQDGHPLYNGKRIIGSSIMRSFALFVEDKKMKEYPRDLPPCPICGNVLFFADPADIQKLYG